MRGHIIAVAIGFAAAVSVANEAMTQEGLDRGYPLSRRISIDEAVSLFLNKKEKGIVIINLTMADFPCKMMSIIISWNVDGKLQKTFFRWEKSGYGIKALAPGEYTVFSVSCAEDLDRSANAFRGPFATFDVGAGELVDAGVLALRFQLKTDGIFEKSGTLHKAVERSSPDADKKLKQDLPHSFMRIVHRPMTILGPVDVGVEHKIKIF
jgi:hypothetical protein